MNTTNLLHQAFPSLLLHEELREDGELALYRGRRAGDGEAILAILTVSDRPSPDVVERLEHEFALKEELARSWSAPPLELLRQGERVVLILRDPGGVPLETLLQSGARLPVAEGLRLGTGLAACLSHVHARGLIHRDLKPAHVLVDLDKGMVHLTGFGLADRQARGRLESRPPETLAGTLAYMAPEQTGRMNHAVDARADLYAVGVILYEVLTGTLPFTATDPLELIHAHLARQPVPPVKSHPIIPALLSNLILTLLAKTPEERYQTCRGLEADLRSCLEALNGAGGIDPFPLGEHDVPDRLLLPEKLFGREREVAEILRAWERAAQGNGLELVLVSGYSGVGKSSLVHELRRSLAPTRAMFAAGKFDQYQRGIPYATLAEALRGLVRALLAEPEEEASRWRQVLGQALGPNGGVVAEIVPELELLLGRQPEVPVLEPRDAQNRFRAVFVRFLGALATKEHPLLLFLDDLQWLDAATLEFVEHLLTPPGVPHLLLIVAYRDNEVSASHPLAITLQTIRKNGAVVTDVVLSPLALADAVSLVANMLRSRREKVELLAELAHGKTGGNPFFLIHFLTSLHEEGLLRFSPREGGWTWQVESIRAKGYTDNVLDLMVRKLTRLPSPTQDAVKSLAILGMGAELAILARVLEAPAAPVRLHLCDAEQAGLVEVFGSNYAFLHDRIREAAYALIPLEARTRGHLRVGRLLQEDRRVEDVEDVFALADHFSKAVALLEDDGERARVRHLFTRAGKKAKAAIAFKVARDYFAQASDLLPEGRWLASYDEVFSILLELAECEYLVGHLERAEELFLELLANAQSDLGKVAVHRLRIKVYLVSGRFAEALQAGLQGLRLLGIDCPQGDEAIAHAIATEEAVVATRLLGRHVSDLVGAATVTDARVAATIDCVADAILASILTQGLTPWLVLQGLKLCLEHGNIRSSSVIYIFRAITLVRFPDAIQSALAFSDLAVALNEKYGDAQLHPFVLMFHAGFVHPWGRPFASANPLLHEAFVEAVQVGDHINSSRCGLQETWNRIDAGDTFAEIRAAAESYLDFAIRNENRFVPVLRQFLQFLACLEGKTAGPMTFDGDDFQEEDALALYRKHRYTPGFRLFWALKQMAAIILGHPQDALGCAVAREELPMGLVFPFQASEVFFHAMAAATYYGEAPDQQAELAATLEAQLQWLQQWAQANPENFLDRTLLVQAEKARIEGRNLNVMHLYEQTIASAQENGHIHIESLASERAARFYLTLGLSQNGYGYLRAARAGYLRWGATAKVAQLDREFPGLERPALPTPTATIGVPTTQLDVPQVIQASQALSGEIELGKLVETLLGLVLEQAGADRGLLLLPEGKDFLVEAEAVTSSDGLHVNVPHAPMEAGQLSEPVFRYVLRTRERVLLDDATSPGDLFGQDPYLQQEKPRSLLCLPLLKQSRLVGVLYLENRLAAGVFTPNRVATLEVLASQAAIALANARLYSALDEERSRLQTVIGQVPVGLIIAEAPSGRFLVTNAQAHHLMRQELHLAGSVAEYDRFQGFHPDGRRYEPEEWPLARALRTGETVSAEEIEMRWADGIRGWLSVSAAPIHAAAGQLTAAVVVYQDITERRRREEALKASEERFAKAFHSNSTAMAVLRREDWTFVEVNECFLSLLGYGVEEVVGRVCVDLGTWFRELLEQAGARLAQGVGLRVEELVALDKAGEEKTLLVSVDAIELAGENCFLASFSDLTARKVVEEQLRQSQKMEAIGSLAGGVAHDFNNILTAINGYSELVLMGMNEHDPKYELVRDIRASGERAADLTRQLLEFSRKESVQTRVQTINSIVRETEGMLRRLIEAHVTLSTRLDPAAGFIDVNRGQVVQILLNLVVNARDAMPHGGELRLETEPVVLTHPPEEALLPVGPGRYVTLTVRDTGMGMTPEVRSKIFEPFFTTKGVGKGTGLGLAVVYGILKRLGGGIVVSSAPGHGTIFRIYFPEAHEQGAETGEALQMEVTKPMHGRERVLVVEDEDVVRRFIRQALSAQGYEVVEARNGKEALQVLEQGDVVDLLLTDLMMPELGGRELAERVRERAPSLPILFTSGYSRHVGPFQEALASGEHLLAKPFGPRDLVRKVREILDRPRSAK